MLPPTIGCACNDRVSRRRGVGNGPDPWSGRRALVLLLLLLLLNLVHALLEVLDVLLDLVDGVLGGGVVGLLPARALELVHAVPEGLLLRLEVVEVALGGRVARARLEIVYALLEVGHAGRARALGRLAG